MTEPSPPFHPLTWLRNSFLAGVAVVLPFVVTVWLIWTVVSIIDHNVAPLLPPILRSAAEAIPGVGVVFAILFLTLIGALAANLVGRWVVGAADRLIANLPFVRSIYGGAKQVFGQIAKPENTSFQKAVLVEFPMPDCWTIGFLTNDDATEIMRDLGDVGDEVADHVAVYVPQAPIPTSGFLLYFPRSAIRELSMSPEEALKRVISLGIIRDGGADALGGPKVPRA
jgi:uncharacterized membrane protein